MPPRPAPVSEKIKPANQAWARRISLLSKAGYSRSHWIVLEAEFWIALELISKRRKLPLDELLDEINRDYRSTSNRTPLTLVEAARVFVARNFVDDAATKNETAEIVSQLNEELGKLDIQSKPHFYIVAD